MASLRKIEYDRDRNDLLINLLTDHSIRISVQDAFEQDGPPFRLNLWYGILNENPLNQNVEDFNQNNLINWKNRVVHISNDKIQSSWSNLTNNFTVSRWYLKFTFYHKQTSQQHKPRNFRQRRILYLCHWKHDPYYWVLSYISNDKCNKVIMPSRTWLILDHRSYLYFFYDSEVIILHKRILTPYDPSGRHIVRYSRLNYKRFFICQEISLRRKIQLFHRHHKSIYALYVLSVSIIIVLVFYGYRFRSSNNCRQPNTHTQPGFSEESFSGELSFDQQELLSSLSENLAMFRDPQDDSIPRAIPLLMERPKFKLILSAQSPPKSI